AERDREGGIGTGANRHFDWIRIQIFAGRGNIESVGRRDRARAADGVCSQAEGCKRLPDAADVFAAVVGRGRSNDAVAHMREGWRALGVAQAFDDVARSADIALVGTGAGVVVEVLVVAV